MKVLVVDDHKYNRDLLGFILDDYGYGYLEAENGLQACTIVEQDVAIDIVLMAINMPGMDGLGAARQIKQRYPNRLISILFVTALDDDKTLAHCLAAGGDDFLPKPVSESVMIAKLEFHSRTMQLHRDLQQSNNELQCYRRVMARESSAMARHFREGAESQSDNSAAHVPQLSAALPLSMGVKLNPGAIRAGDVVAQLLLMIENYKGVKAHKDLLFTLLTELYNNAVDHGLLALESTLKRDPDGFAEYYEMRQKRLEELTEGEVMVHIKGVPAVDETPALLCIQMTDSGAGFDHEPLMARLGQDVDSLADEEEAFGRGIRLMASLCQSIRYDNGGCTVDVTYALD